MFKRKNELLTNEYKGKLSRYLGCNKSDIFLYWKGRVALYAILKAMGIKAGDEVILQAYTCVVVANAVLYLGATPVYVDIDEDTYNMNIDQVEKKITDKTKVIICQNTYGLSSNLEKLMDLAKKYKIYTVEDCTHGFGGHYNGKPNGSYCDASFFSTQWSKPFSTGIGGFSVIHNNGLKRLIQKMEAHKIKPKKKETMNLKALYVAREYTINGLTYWPMVKLYRLLSKNNLVVGSSSGGEISSPKMAEDFFKDMSVCQINKGMQSLKGFAKLQTLRKINGKAYSSFLLKNNKNHVKKLYFDNHIFLRYPLRVRDREAFKAAAMKDKIILGEWLDSPLY
ncbi:MAG TPA: aminotransferase class I/II-fold pyridoxal phosphate-dependent enzyme, partial [Anaerovoracaceae bacterium]|nr:aminotransferase class I/II-fold pyridoxal phosphate-dependent enzyme [Anaerovoracaceae bacterium]